MGMPYGKTNTLKLDAIKQMEITNMGKLYLPTKLGILPTLRCNCRCTVCAESSGPNLNTRMDARELRSLLDQARRLGIMLIHISGGEPMLIIDMLLDVMKYGKKHGMTFSITTNASFATSYEKAHRILKKLKNVGLVEIRISTDSLHQQYVPLERAYNCIRASLDIGMIVHVNVMYTRKKSNLRTIKELLERLDEDYGIEQRTVEKIYDEHLFRLTLENNRTIQIVYSGVKATGRAELILNECLKSRCSVDSTIYVFPDGHAEPCCGFADAKGNRLEALSLGNIKKDSLQDMIKNANQNIIILSLCRNGMSEICYIARKLSRKDIGRKEFGDCWACGQIFNDSKLMDQIRQQLNKRYNT